MKQPVKVIFIPGNGGGTPRDAWFPYLENKLTELGIKVIARDFPDNDIGRETSWLPFLKHDLQADQNTILIGYSTGAIAAMRFAENNKLLGSILVATYYTDLGDEKEKASGYFDRPWNWKAIKKNQRWVVQLASSDDPYIPVAEARFVHQKLGTEYYEYPDQGHFGPDIEKIAFPEIVNIIKTKLKRADNQKSPSASPSAQTCTTDLKSELQRLKVPGLAAGIVKNGRLVCTAVAGMANIEQNRPVTPDTLFILASVSKTVTATALMTLYDQGKFKLDDDINKYLPFQMHIPSYPTSPITFRQLLTHTCSIIDNDKVINSLVVQGDSPVALKDFMQGYLTPGGQYYSKRANFHSSCPGTVYEYSNIGATLIGYLVEVLSGTEFNQYCKDSIFTPLGMTNTSYKLAGLDPSHIAMPYKRSRHRYSRNAANCFKPYGHYGEADWPAGMLRTSVSQLARFLIMFMQLGEYEGQRLLAQSTVQEMRRVQFPQLDPHQGLIWYYDSFSNSGQKVLGHNGSDDGAASNMFFDPATGAGVILIANRDWNNANDESPVADALMDKLFQVAKGY